MERADVFNVPFSGKNMRNSNFILCLRRFLSIALRIPSVEDEERSLKSSIEFDWESETNIRV